MRGRLHISRDTGVLLAALAFLSFAILLAVLFPPQGGRVAQRPTAAATIAQATAVVAPAADRATPSPLAPTQISLAPSPTAPAPAAYPEPATSPSPEVVVGAATVDPLQAPGGAYPPPGGLGTVTVEQPDPTTLGQQLLPTPTAPGGAAATAPAAPSPTFAPQVVTPIPPPDTPVPTQPAAPVAPAAPAVPPAPRPTRTPAPPTAVPITVLRGTTYWRASDSPVLLSRDTQVAPQASLIVEPGVEVRLGPGVSLFVDGKLYALGQAGRQVRFVGSENRRWEGLFARGGSEVVLEHVELRGGGAGGTLLASDGGNLTIRASRLTDNGGHVRASGSRVELRDTEIAANDMPYGAALEISFERSGSVTLIGNRIGPNRMVAGVPTVAITARGPADVVSLDLQGNLLYGAEGPNLTLNTNGQLQGNLICNTLYAGSNGLSVISALPQTPGLPLLTIRNNAIEQHTPPIIPFYLEHGIGRGATSDVAIDMRENWWEAAEGPYEPDRHADGRGDAPGDMVEFAPWLTTRPACAPGI